MAAEATPEAGFADGDGELARFDGPSGLAAAEDGTIFVADTNNHLVILSQSVLSSPVSFRRDVSEEVMNNLSLTVSL